MTIIFMDACIAAFIASFTASLGGSIMLTIPTNTNPDSISSIDIHSFQTSISLYAYERLRIAPDACILSRSLSSFSCVGVSGMFSSMVICVQHGKSVCSDHFTYIRNVPSSNSRTILIRFLLESKLHSCTKGNCLFISTIESQNFLASVWSAHSVGSPITRQWGCSLSGERIAALLHNVHIDRKNQKFSEFFGCGSNDHVGSYPTQCTAYMVLLCHTDCTVISLVVKVHVLSVQITLTAHSVSTAESFLTSAFFLARYHAADANDIFTCAGSHWGTIEAPIHIANKSACCISQSSNNVITNNATHTTAVVLVRIAVVWLSSFWSGDISSTALLVSNAILHSSVDIHVPTTIHKPFPVAMVVHI